MTTAHTAQLHILYTDHLAGRLDWLPRLYAALKRVRAALIGPVLLLDLGESCAPGVAECAATQGRATLFVLDAMGYDVAYLTPAEAEGLDAAARQRLIERLTLALCGPPDWGFLPVVTRQAGPHRVHCVSPGTDLDDLPPDELRIIPAWTEETVRLQGCALVLPGGGGKTFGHATVRFEQAGTGWRPAAAEARRVPVPDAVVADATVAAAVAFVRDEIRLVSDSGRA
ncbi:MAG: hypothetical protein Kow0077_08700 [Anaerolineae bacterium]